MCKRTRKVRRPARASEIPAFWEQPLPEGQRLIVLAREAGMLDEVEAQALVALGLQNDLGGVADYIRAKGA